MSIEMENPKTLVELLDAVANYVQQIRIATSIGDRARITLALSEAERLVTLAMDKTEEPDSELLDWLEQETKKSPTGISFDWCHYAEEGQVLEHGFRFMRQHFLGDRAKSLREAIKLARK